MLIFWKNVDLDRFGLNQRCKANGFNGSLKVPFCCQSSLVAQRSKEYGAHGAQRIEAIWLEVFAT